MIDASPYRSPLPYPIPRELGRNIRFARILQSLYSGPDSELTAVHEYAYHRIFTTAEHPEPAGVLGGISMVEMHHLGLLGDCILRLGLHPTYSFYQGTRRARWSPAFVRYGRTLKAIIDLSIKGEQTAIESYYAAAHRIPDREIGALLRRIIVDEELHIRALTDLRKKL
ncbi:MAG: rubrerythrin [Oscillospiraceae bacterium]|nr:rubrerythrin [Oscillospiraceae bacterium]